VVGSDEPFNWEVHNANDNQPKRFVSHLPYTYEISNRSVLMCDAGS